MKIIKYVMNTALSWEERYKELEQHHLEETAILYREIQEWQHQASVLIAEPVAWAVWEAEGDDELYNEEGDRVDCLIFFDAERALNKVYEYEEEGTRPITPLVPVWKKA